MLPLTSKLGINIVRISLEMMSRFDESGDYAQDNLVSSIMNDLEKLDKVISKKMESENGN